MEPLICFKYLSIPFSPAFGFRTRSQPRQGAVHGVWGTAPTSKNGLPAATLEVRFEVRPAGARSNG